MSQTYTFTKIFSTPVPHSSESDLVTISKIVVPRIQRPYAQGRNGEAETKIRENFLKDIFKSLKNDSPMDMNFIYGAVKENKENDSAEFVMELLDGQQRFTTLYLLHWYLLNKENKQDNPVYEPIRYALKSFVYETRTTATKFCKSLSVYVCDLDGEKPSEKINKARWYYRSYDKDSTIAGMLVMLDAIDSYYKNNRIADAIDKVDNLQFYVLPLMQFGKSEELYMKMNARGLPLSVFDNFKADFTGAMNKVTSLREEMVLLEGGFEGDMVSHCENISIKLDAKWIDLFWDNTKKKNSDISYMRFFSRFFACRYLIDSNLAPKDMRGTETAVNVFYTQAEKSKGEYLGFDEYADELEAHPEYFSAIEKILDTLQQHKMLVEESLTPVWDEGKKGNFFVDSSVNFTQTLLTVMGAIEEFILTFKTFDEALYEEWMRVVWNIVENTDIDNLERVATTLRNFGRMIRAIANALDNESEFAISRESMSNITKASSFYEALANCAELPTSDDDNRWARPFKEEMEKAKRITENYAWLEQFMLIEKHPYFKGTTNFYYTEDMSLADFKHRCELISDMFDSKGISADYRKKHILIRALMSRLSSWKDLARQYITENSETHKYLKILLISDSRIHEMLASILDRSETKEEVIVGLNEAAQELVTYTGKETWELQLAIACNALRKDVRLYNWIVNQPSPVYVHWKNGHIAVAIPGKWFERYFIDSEREKMAQKFIEDFGMQYYEDEDVHASLNDYNTYGRYKGEDAIFYYCYDEKGEYSFNINFSNGHRFRIFVQFPSRVKAKRFLEIAEVGYIDQNDPYCVYMDLDENDNELTYYSAKSYIELKQYVVEAADVAKKTLIKMGVTE